MGSIRGVAVGSLSLAMLYNVLTAKGQLDTLAGLPGKAAHWLIAPDVPLIPDLRTGTGAAAPAPGASVAPSGLSGLQVPTGAGTPKSV